MSSKNVYLINFKIDKILFFAGVLLIIGLSTFLKVYHTMHNEERIKHERLKDKQEKVVY